MKLLPLWIIILAVALGCAGGNRTSTPPKKESATKTRDLSAEVSLSNAGVIIKNTDADDIPSITMKLNMKDFGGNDGVASIGDLPKGRSVTVPYGKFTVGTKRFKIEDTEILTIYVKSSNGASKLFICPGTRCQPAP